MNNDCFRPVSIRATIDLSSFTGNAPEDGAIDPISIQRYLQKLTFTGTDTTPTAANGSTLYLNNIPIALNAGMNGAAILAAINDLSDLHHLIATDSSGAIVLNSEPLYEHFGCVITGEASLLTSLGLAAPTITDVEANTDVLDNRAKVRGNIRWEQLVKIMENEVNPLYIGGIRMTANDIDTQPTALSFTATYQNFNSIYTYDESNSDALMTGLLALRRMIARGLTTTSIWNEPVLTPSSEGTASSMIVDSVTAQQLTNSLSTAESLITLDVINLVR